MENILFNNKANNLANNQSDKQGFEQSTNSGTYQSLIESLEESIKLLAAEQVSLSNQVKMNMESSKKDKDQLEIIIQRSDNDKKDLIKNLMTTLEGMKRELDELKSVNTKNVADAMAKVEATCRALEEERRKSAEKHIEMLREIKDLELAIRQIPNPNWKERAKQFATELGITVGAIVVLLGCVKLMVVLSQFF